MDINKMPPEQVMAMARNAAPANRMSFNAVDIFAVLAFEAEKIVMARSQVAATGQLPPPHTLLMLVNRMRDLAATIMTQTAQAPSSPIPPRPDLANSN